MIWKLMLSSKKIRKLSLSNSLPYMLVNILITGTLTPIQRRNSFLTIAIFSLKHNLMQSIEGHYTERT